MRRLLRPTLRLPEPRRRLPIQDLRSERSYEDGHYNCVSTLGKPPDRLIPTAKRFRETNLPAWQQANQGRVARVQRTHHKESLGSVYSGRFNQITHFFKRSHIAN